MTLIEAFCNSLNCDNYADHAASFDYMWFLIYTFIATWLSTTAVIVSWSVQHMARCSWYGS